MAARHRRARGSRTWRTPRRDAPRTPAPGTAAPDARRPRPTPGGTWSRTGPGGCTSPRAADPSAHLGDDRVHAGGRASAADVGRGRLEHPPQGVTRSPPPGTGEPPNGRSGGNVAAAPAPTARPPRRRRGRRAPAARRAAPAPPATPAPGSMRRSVRPVAASATAPTPGAPGVLPPGRGRVVPARFAAIAVGQGREQRRRILEVHRRGPGQHTGERLEVVEVGRRGDRGESPARARDVAELLEHGLVADLGEHPAEGEHELEHEHDRQHRGRAVRRPASAEMSSPMHIAARPASAAPIISSPSGQPRTGRTPVRPGRRSRAPRAPPTAGS